MQRAFIKILLIVFIAVTAMVMGDAAAKIMGQNGASPFFITWSRFALGAMFLLPFCGLQRMELKKLTDKGILLRGGLVVTANVCNMIALQTEPIANVFGAFFTGPIVAYFLSAIILKETINATRTTLLICGFIGVLLVVKPGFGFTIGVGFAFVAGCLHGTFLVMTRALSSQYRPRFLLITQMLVGSFVLLPLAFTHALPVFDLHMIGLMFISAGCSGVGNYLLVIANKTTSTSIVAPLIYLQLISATFVGYVVFADWPDAIAFTGLVIIIASGLGSLWFARRDIST